MSDDPTNMFAGLKKKSKKKVQIADLDEDTPTATLTPDASKGEDSVLPQDKDGDLTLKEEEPLDFSDLKKVRLCSIPSPNVTFGPPSSTMQEQQLHCWGLQSGSYCCGANMG